MEDFTKKLSSKLEKIVDGNMRIQGSGQAESEEELESNMSPIRVVINDFMSIVAEIFREFAKPEEDDGKNRTQWDIGAWDDG
jgi:hypothetical protein